MSKHYNKQKQLPEFEQLFSSLFRINNDGSLFIQCKPFYMRDWEILYRMYLKFPGSSVNIVKSNYEISGIVYRYTSTGIVLTNVEIKLHQKEIR